ncbi:FecR family protein [Pedobacter sp. GR22-6]|uniref:FecR family protein n=1 Tax=Pedobacter sp. GR22-6 TaxID=3127957 RepID=UPI00307E3A01
MTQEQIDLLSQKIADQSISDEELQEYYSWLISDDQLPLEVSNAVSKEELQKRIYLNIATKANFKLIEPKKQTQLWPKIVAIAAAVATIVVGAYFFNYHKDSQNTQNISSTNDVAPGKQGATLTLANGKKIRLSDAANGELARQAGVKVTKLASGQLVYELESSSAVGTDLAAVNTLSTAKGETYRLRLPDGSLVWLNAASSLTYSAGLLEGGVRKIKLAGEGYFEVAKDKEHPFVVSTGKQDIEVLGTHFNVNSYTDEQVVRTTLLEGSVRLNAFGSQGERKGLVLKPGQQALMWDDRFLLKEIDPDVAVAWVNNKFIFEDTDVRTIMRMLERWYNVEVIYQGPVPTDNLGGSVSRFDNISSVLKILEAAGDIHFRLEGRKLYVSKS